jgi:dipeptidyl aminopeptidase/acylaminoacyl peptidase
LLIHGRDDDVCPSQEAEKLFNAMRRLGRTAQLAVYEGEGHVLAEWSSANALDATRRILAFLDRHLRDRR